MSELKLEKAKLRKEIRSAFPGQEIRDTESRKIVSHLLAWPELQRAETICLYVPLRREADVWPLIEQLMQMPEKKVVLPRVEGPGEMTLRTVDSPEKLIPGAYDIPEPAADAEVVAPEALDLLIVPLEAVDRQGMRLGKGGGYYDRLLPKVKCPAVGAALHYQQVEVIPAEAWDHPLDAVVDADGIRFYSEFTQKNNK